MQCSNAKIPIELTSFGSSKDSNLLHDPNACMPIEINDEFLGIIKEVNFEQL